GLLLRRMSVESTRQMAVIGRQHSNDVTFDAPEARTQRLTVLPSDFKECRHIGHASDQSMRIIRTATIRRHDRKQLILIRFFPAVLHGTAGSAIHVVWEVRQHLPYLLECGGV